MSRDGRANRRAAGARRALRVERIVEWDASEPGEAAFVARMGTLGPERRAVVVLRYGIGLGPAEIAEVLDVPLGTVHSRLARALTQLREEVDAHADGA